MTLPHELEKLRDELAFESMEKYNAKEHEGGNKFEPHFSGFCYGWDACFQALTEAAGEFDGRAFFTWIETLPDRLRPDAETGARWMFGQMSARIGLAEGERSYHARSAGDLAQKCEQLEARLAESEALVKSKIEIGEGFLDELSAAETRVRELSQLLKDKGIR